MSEKGKKAIRLYTEQDSSSNRATAVDSAPEKSRVCGISSTTGEKGGGGAQLGEKPSCREELCS